MLLGTKMNFTDFNECIKKALEDKEIKNNKRNSK